MQAVVVGADAAARGPLGHRGQVRREQDGPDRGDVRRVGPVVPVPGRAAPCAARSRTGRRSGSVVIRLRLPPVPRGCEDVAEQIGPVGHDPIDAEVEQAVHLGGRVDRPDVHLLAELVRPVDEGARHDLEASPARWHLRSQPTSRHDGAQGPEGALEVLPPRARSRRSRPWGRAVPGSVATAAPRRSRRTPGPMPGARRCSGPAARSPSWTWRRC